MGVGWMGTYRSMRQIRGETRMEALAAAQASAPRRRARWDVFHWIFSVFTPGIGGRGTGVLGMGRSFRAGSGSPPSAPPRPASGICERRRTCGSYLQV